MKINDQSHKYSWLKAWYRCVLLHIVFSVTVQLIFHFDKVEELRFYESIFMIFTVGLVFLFLSLLLIQLLSLLLIKLSKFNPIVIIIQGLLIGSFIGLGISGFDFELKKGLIDELFVLRPILYICFLYGGLIGLVFANSLINKDSKI